MAAKVTVKLPDIKIKGPTRILWGRLAEDVAGDVQKRTLAGLDVNNRTFPAYSPKYRQLRQKAGRSTRPNMSFSNRMLSSVTRGVRATKQGFKVVLSGTEGFKAWVNERTGRDFFGLSKKQKDKITAQVTRLYTKANKLKKR